MNHAKAPLSYAFYDGEEEIDELWEKLMKCAFIMTIIATSKEMFTNQNDAKSEEEPDCYDVLDGVDLD